MNELFFSLTLLTSTALTDQIRANKPSIDPTLARSIATINAEMCQKYKVDCKLVTAIQMQESGYRLNVVAGGDYGIMQVNEYNIKAYGLSKERLLTDLSYSIENGVMILAYFKRWKRWEKKWWCRYNVGTGPLTKVRGGCNMYINRVERYL